MKSLLVTGGSGLLGSAVVAEAIGEYKVFSTYQRNPVSLEGAEFVKANLLDENDMESLALAKPDFIVHCAALTNVDYCESHPDEAYRQNAQASLNVAGMARDLGSYLIHISTDGVFDGEKGHYSENDSPNPINAYAKSKLDGERKVRETYDHCCIARTNIFGWNPTARKSMAEWMLSTLRSGKTLPAFKDVVISPLFVNDLADTLFELCRLEHEGTIHVGSRDSSSKLQFACDLADVFGLDSSNIKPISVDELYLEARRPKNTSLDVKRISSLLKRDMPSVLEGIRRMKLVGSSEYTRRTNDG